MRLKTKYATDSKIKLVMKRLPDSTREEKAAFKKLFKVAKKTPGRLCGNVCVEFKDGIATLGRFGISRKEYTCGYEQISSALALYRAVSIFECGTDDPKHQDFYKCNWSVTLKHKSGQHLMLGEWKGGFNIFTEAHDVKELPEDFVKDCEAFLTWFVSLNVPIGYDGVVAGSVA